MIQNSDLLEGLDTVQIWRLNNLWTTIAFASVVGLKGVGSRKREMGMKKRKERANKNLGR